MSQLKLYIYGLKLISMLLLNGQFGIATTFYAEEDPWNPDSHLACYGRDMDDSDNVVAHPTLPCRSQVMIYNIRTKLSTISYVGDRGPKRAIIDLSPSVAKRIKSNGYERVVIFPLPEKEEDK